MADVTIDVDMGKAWLIACRSEDTYELIRRETDERASRANALSAGFKTELYHRDHKSPAVGGTSPRYAAHTGRPRGSVPVGIVYTGNYAAQKENMLHNTLLKCI